MFPNMVGDADMVPVTDATFRWHHHIDAYNTYKTSNPTEMFHLWGLGRPPRIIEMKEKSALDVMDLPHMVENSKDKVCREW